MLTHVQIFEAFKMNVNSCLNFLGVLTRSLIESIDIALYSALQLRVFPYNK